METISTEILEGLSGYGCTGAKCYHCGADYGLHHYDTNQCPVGGVEETRDGHKQQWAETKFLHDRYAKLIINAPETAERLEQAEKDAIDLAKDIIPLKGDSHKIYSRIAEMAKKADAILLKYAEQTKP